MMKYWIVVTAGVIFAIASLSIAADQTQLKSLSDELADIAKSWIKDADHADKLKAVEKKLNAFTYDLEILPELKKYLKRGAPKPQSLFQVNHLLKPLLRSEAEVIRTILPDVKTAYGKMCKYHIPPPPGKKPRKKPGKKPRKSRRKTSADSVMRQLAKVQRAGEKKMARDRPLVKQNAQAHVMTLIYYELLLLANDPAEDQVVVDGMMAYVAKNDLTYMHVMKMVIRYAEEFSATRARFFHKAFVKHGNKYRDSFGKFSRPNTLILRPAGTNLVPFENSYPAFQLLNAANAISARAGTAKVAVPSKAKIKIDNDRLVKAEKAREAAEKKRAKSK